MPAPQLDRAAVLREVAGGLRNEAKRLLRSKENQDFADLKGALYLARREAESEFDYMARIKRISGFAHQAIGRLCSHTYNPGPHRSVGDAAADAFLQEVYDHVHIDAIMAEAERLSTINDVAGIQVHWTGDPDRPIDLQLWGAEEFVVFLSPDDPRRPEAVVTIDQYDEQTRFRVWFADAVHTFVTRKAGGDDGRQTAGGVMAEELVDSPQPNPYGVIPFGWVAYRPQVRQFWPAGIGDFLREAEDVINTMLSDLAESIQKYGFPIGIFSNVDPAFNPEVGRGRFLRLNRAGASYSGDGFEAAGDPTASYLQAQLAIEEIWQDIRSYVAQVAEAIGLPPSALTLDYTDAPSGVSIVARAFPLLERARQRRPIYQRAETELARLICRIRGAMAGDAGAIAAAHRLKVLLAWPEPRVPIPGPDRDETDAWEIGLGIKSRLAVIEERYGLQHDQAIAHLKQVAEDEATARAILPEPETAPPAEPGQPGEPAPSEPKTEPTRNPERTV